MKQMLMIVAQFVLIAPMVGHAATAQSHQQGTPMAGPAQGAAPMHSFVKGTSSVGIPMQLTSNHIYVQATINGKPLWFLLDTGAAASVIEKSRADELGLEQTGNVRAMGAGEGSVQAYMVPDVSYSVQGVEMQHQMLVAIPLKPLEPFEGRDMDGVLGHSFISQFVVEIDYAANRVNLYDPKTYTYTGKGTRIPIDVSARIPTVKARITEPGQTPLEGVFMLDTGARNALTLHNAFVQGSWVKSIADRSREAAHGIGVGGRSRSRVGRIGALEFGGFTFERPVTGFSYDTKGAMANDRISGTIGGDVLRRFKVILDYSRGEMILEKNAAFSEPFEYDMFGALLAVDGGDRKAFKVSQVIDDSPALDAGLKEGDLILAIDGKPVDAYTLEEARQLFREEGRTVKLRIASGETVREAKVTTRRLL